MAELFLCLSKSVQFPVSAQKHIYVYIRGDQLNMAVFFSTLVKSDLFIAHMSISVEWTGHFIQRNRKTRSSLNGHPV